MTMRKFISKAAGLISVLAITLTILGCNQLTTPETPAASASSASAKKETVVKPVFSVNAGEVSSGTKVTITTTTSGATIYYTTDGKDPTTSSTKYAEAVEIKTACTVKAIAVKDGMTNSDVASAAYTIKVVVGVPEEVQNTDWYKVCNTALILNADGTGTRYMEDGSSYNFKYTYTQYESSGGYITATKTDNTTERYEFFTSLFVFLDSEKTGLTDNRYQLTKLYSPSDSAAYVGCWVTQIKREQESGGNSYMDYQCSEIWNFSSDKYTTKKDEGFATYVSPSYTKVWDTVRHSVIQADYTYNHSSALLTVTNAKVTSYKDDSGTDKLEEYKTNHNNSTDVTEDNGSTTTKFTVNGHLLTVSKTKDGTTTTTLYFKK